VCCCISENLSRLHPVHDLIPNYSVENSRFYQGLSQCDFSLFMQVPEKGTQSTRPSRSLAVCFGGDPHGQVTDSGVVKKNLDMLKMSDILKLALIVIMTFVVLQVHL